MKKILSFFLIALTLCSTVTAATIIDETALVTAHFENEKGEKTDTAKKGDTVYYTVSLNGIDKTKCGHIGVIKLDFSYPQNALSPTLSDDDKRYVDEKSFTCPTIPDGYKDSVYATAPEKNKLVFYYNYNITKIKQSAITKNGVVFRIALKVLKTGNFSIDFMKDTCSAAAWNKTENRVAGYSLTYSPAPTLKIPENKGISEPTKTDTVNKSEPETHADAKILYLKRKGRKVIVKWSGCVCHKKYRIKYSYKKNMKKAKYKIVNAKRVTLRNLKKGKRLYVRVKVLGGKYGIRKSIKIY